jgi:hypothetical protein
MTALFCVSRDPFQPWKTAERVWAEGRRRGLRVFVALDSRTSAEDAARVATMVDAVRPFTGNCCEDAFGLIAELPEDWVLRIDDDEEPSDLCWRLALEPPFKARFGIPVIPILDGKMWRPDVGIQERLFPRERWTWRGGFNGRSDSPFRSVVIGTNPGVIIWHHSLAAPRDEREAKAARYATLGPGDHRSRLIYEEHPDDLVPMPAHVAAQLPNYKRSRQN